MAKVPESAPATWLDAVPEKFLLVAAAKIIHEAPIKPEPVLEKAKERDAL